MFLANSWYAIGWSNELAAGKVLARTCLNIPLVAFRSEDGKLGALQDRCPHRFAPLHLGKLVAQGLQCGYHGLVFDPSGACVHNPQGPALRGLAVKSYPLHEAYQLLWLWPGDPTRADPALIPNLDFIDQVDPVTLAPGYLHVKANYELLNDNLLDLSHVDFLHPRTVAQGNLGTARPSSGVDGDRVWIRWEAKAVEPSPMNALYMGEGPIDLMTEVLWQAAGNMRGRLVMTTAGGEPRRAVTHAYHLMTPETATTTHYLFCSAREFCKDDPEMTAAYAEFGRKAFEEEDKPMIEAVQQSMGADGDLLAMHPRLLPNDGGSMRARRKLQAMIRAEAGQADDGDLRTDQAGSMYQTGSMQ